jgi:putative endonuclease
MRAKNYCVYILASPTCTLYTGVTGDLTRRLSEHKQGLVPGFTKKYGVNRLVYYEQYGDVTMAIAREKQIKAWTRAKRVELIESVNPEWKDLSEGWYE